MNAQVGHNLVLESRTSVEGGWNWPYQRKRMKMSCICSYFYSLLCMCQYKSKTSPLQMEFPCVEQFKINEIWIVRQSISLVLVFCINHLILCSWIKSNLIFFFVLDVCGEY